MLSSVRVRPPFPTAVEPDDQPGRRGIKGDGDRLCVSINRAHGAVEWAMGLRPNEGSTLVLLAPPLFMKRYHLN